MGKDTLSSARTPGNVLLTARSSSNGSSLCTPARPSSARGIAAVSITGNVARVSLCARQSYRLLESPSFLRASSRRSIVSAGLSPAFSSSRQPIFRSLSGVTYRSHQPRSITITQIDHLPQPIAGFPWRNLGASAGHDLGGLDRHLDGLSHPAPVRSLSIAQMHVINQSGAFPFRKQPAAFHHIAASFSAGVLEERSQAEAERAPQGHQKTDRPVS